MFDRYLRKITKIEHSKNYPEFLTKVQKNFLEKYQNSPNNGRIAGTLPGLCDSVSFFIFDKNFTFAVKSSMGELGAKDQQTEVSNRNKVHLLKIYESIYLEILEELSLEDRGLNNIQKYDNLKNEALFYLKNVYYSGSDSQLKSEILLLIINDVIYTSIALNRDLQIPSEVRIKALRRVKFSYNSKLKGVIKPSDVFPSRAKLPLKFIPTSNIGLDQDHTLETLAGQSFIKATFDSKAKEPATTAYRRDLLMQAITNYPLNSLQFFEFLLKQNSSLQDQNALIDTLRSCTDEQLNIIFSSQASFFTESNIDVFSQMSKLKFLAGDISPVEETIPEDPKNIKDAIKLISSLRNQIFQSHDRETSLKTDLENQRLLLQGQINRLMSYLQEPEFVQVFKSFHLDPKYVIEHLQTVEKRTMLLMELKIFYETRIKVLRNQYPTLTNDTQSKGHAALSQLNSDYQNMTDLIENIKP